MRKLLLVSAAAGSALLLSACSEGADEAAVPSETDVAASDAVAPAAAEAGAVIDANTATEAQLAEVEGMTPELAAAIVAGQPYADVTAFDAKLRESLSETAAAELRTRVFVPVNLNTASEDAIRLIPGMTPKMEHEFMEYRPYEDMAEFDREIGKYVDAAEVARFRNYVTL